MISRSTDQLNWIVRKMFDRQLNVCSSFVTSIDDEQLVCNGKRKKRNRSTIGYFIFSCSQFVIRVLSSNVHMPPTSDNEQANKKIEQKQEKKKIFI